MELRSSYFKSTVVKWLACTNDILQYFQSMVDTLSSTFCFHKAAIYYRFTGAHFLPTQRYASTGNSYDSVCLSVCHKSVFYRNGWTNWAAFWQFFPPMLHCAIRKFSTFKKYGYFPLDLCHKLRTQKILLWHIDIWNMLSTYMAGWT